MVKRIAPIRVISFFLLATCGALCQSAFRWLASGLELNGSESHELQRQELGTWKSLPDAPSSQPPTQAEKFRTFIDEARSSLTLGAVAVNAGMIRETELGRLAPGQQPSLTALYKGVLIQKSPAPFLASTCIRHFSSRIRVITLRAAAAFWAGRRTQLCPAIG